MAHRSESFRGDRYVPVPPGPPVESSWRGDRPVSAAESTTGLPAIGLTSMPSEPLRPRIAHGPNASAKVQ